MSDPEVSSTLKVNEPYIRPITPEPPKKDATKDTVEFSKEALEEAEIAFSKHFTQVVEESAAEFEKHEVGIVPEVQIMTAVEPSEEIEESSEPFLANASSAPKDKQSLSESKSCTGPEDATACEIRIMQDNVCTRAELALGMPLLALLPDF